MDVERSECKYSPYNSIKTGDIVLLCADTLVGYINRGVTSSNYTHVGIAIWIKSLNPLVLSIDNQNARLCFLEADPFPKMDLLTGKIRSGFRLSYFKDIESDFFKIAIRRLVTFDKKYLDIVTEFILKNVECDYPLSLWPLFRAGFNYDSPTTKPSSNYELSHSDDFFCTQMVANFLNHICYHYEKFVPVWSEMASLTWYEYNIKHQLRPLFKNNYCEILVIKKLSPRSTIIKVSFIFLILSISILIYYLMITTNKRTIK